MEQDKLNWMAFAEYMKGESTAPANLDEYFEKIFHRKYSTNCGETTTYNYTNCDATTTDNYSNCDATTK